MKFDIKLNFNWHKWYSSRNGIEDPKFIPEYLFYKYIEPHYNKLEFYQALSDKTLLDGIFPDIWQPITIVKNRSGVYYDHMKSI